MRQVFYFLIACALLAVSPIAHADNKDPLAQAKGYDAEGEFVEGVLIDDLSAGVPISNSLFSL